MLNKGRDITNGSLYFVTDCIKSANWGIATFYESPAASDYLHLMFDKRSCRWECLGKVEARDGPRSTDIVASDGGGPNQCVFLGGYKIMLQSHVWDKLRSTIVVASQYGESSSPSTRDSLESHRTSGGRIDLSESHQRSSADAGSLTMPGHITKDQANQLKHSVDAPSRITRDQASQLTYTGESWLQVALKEFCSAAAPVRSLISLKFLYVLILFLGASF